MGKFADELKKAMAERGVRQVDIPVLTKKKITQAGISGIFTKKAIPRLDIIDALAAVLKKSQDDFRNYALMDTIERELTRFHKTWNDIRPEITKQGISTQKLPVYDLDDLRDSLSEKGYPLKETDRYISTNLKVSHFTYAVIVNSHVFSPRAMEGDIVILAPYPKRTKEDYGVVRTRKGLLIGRILEGRSEITLETNEPYDIHRLTRKEILFMHKIIAIRKQDIPEIP